MIRSFIVGVRLVEGRATEANKFLAAGVLSALYALARRLSSGVTLSFLTDARA